LSVGKKALTLSSVVAYSNLTCVSTIYTYSGFGSLVPKFAGSNPAEAVGFFRAKKSSARLPSEGK
jgi:hypothetical protein